MLLECIYILWLLSLEEKDYGLNVIFNQPLLIASFVLGLVSGQNAIIIVSGANLRLDESDVAQAEELLATSKVLVCQLEIRPETTLAALTLAKKHKGLCLPFCVFYSFERWFTWLRFEQYVDIFVIVKQGGPKEMAINREVKSPILRVKYNMKMVNKLAIKN